MNMSNQQSEHFRSFSEISVSLFPQYRLIPVGLTRRFCLLTSEDVRVGLDQVVLRTPSGLRVNW
jgi:hypothetical protein